MQLILTLLIDKSISSIMIPEKGGVGALAIEQNDNADEGLAVHAPIDVETGLINGKSVIYHSVSPISNSGPIEFIVPRDNECFLY